MPTRTLQAERANSVDRASLASPIRITQPSASARLSRSPPDAHAQGDDRVLGNYVDAVKAAGFPIGDSIVAGECDPGVVIPATVTSNCDASTQITGTVGARGTVTLPQPHGVKLLVGRAFSDSASGACSFGGTCEVLVSDSANPSIGTRRGSRLWGADGEPEGDNQRRAELRRQGHGHKFPVGDTVTAQECDSTVTSATLATHCDSTTANHRDGGNPRQRDLHRRRGQGPHRECLLGHCRRNRRRGGSCDIVVNDSTSGSYVAIPVGLAS